MSWKIPQKIAKPTQIARVIELVVRGQFMKTAEAVQIVETSNDDFHYNKFSYVIEKAGLKLFFKYELQGKTHLRQMHMLWTPYSSAVIFESDELRKEHTKRFKLQ